LTRRASTPERSLHHSSEAMLMFSLWLPNRFQSQKHGFGNFMNRYAKRKELTLHIPNAGGEPRAIAAARHERRLLGVGSTAMFGWGYSGGLLGGCPSPRDAVPLVVLPEAPATLPHPCALHQPT
jgi:hypothetical protein